MQKEHKIFICRVFFWPQLLLMLNIITQSFVAYYYSYIQIDLGLFFLVEFIVPAIVYFVLSFLWEGMRYYWHHHPDENGREKNE